MQELNTKTTIQDFDHAAVGYDDTFTFSNIGQMQRSRVYHWLEELKVHHTSRNVLELNCGTGYDAGYLQRKGHKVLATDASPEMIRLAEQQTDDVVFKELKFQEIESLENLNEQDLIFSNFGGLNCLSSEELLVLIDKLGGKMKKGSQLVWVIMPKKCWMETFYFLLKLDWKKAFRRNTSEAVMVNVEGKDVGTWYYSPAEVKNMLNGHFEVELIRPVAAFLPPSYLEPFFKRRIGLLKFLNRLEKRWARSTFLATRSDHYIIAARKR